MKIRGDAVKHAAAATSAPDREALWPSTDGRVFGMLGVLIDVFGNQ